MDAAMSDQVAATDPVPAQAELAAAIAKELERNGFMGWFVANAESALWVERTPEQEIGRVAASIAVPLIVADRDRLRAGIHKAIEDLKGGDCAFWACEGWEVEPVDMVTCRRCYSIHDLQKLLGDTPGGPR
jgi:hypothetical protein